MSAAPPTRRELWRRRLQRLRVRARGVALFGLGVLAALLALGLSRLLNPAPTPLGPNEVGQIVVALMASATPPPAFSANVYRAIQPSLVLIQTQGDEDRIGSGVVVNDRGDILTSLHVVATADAIIVTFADGTESPAEVAVRSPENDIAVLRALTPPAQIIPAMLGNPQAMHIGDEAYVVGHPLGLYGSMSAGVVSGLDRSFQPASDRPRLKGLIQVDAAVNPGNSGGPLLNRYGQVVGIVTGLVNPTQQEVFIGIGFAVPISVAGGAAGLPPY